MTDRVYWAVWHNLTDIVLVATASVIVWSFV